MRIVLVCDDLVQYGGHERVIMEVCRMFPKAPLYTTAATPEWKKICKENRIELKTSWIQNIPFFKKMNRVYAPFLLYILALEGFRFDEYDLVISLSSRFAHGVLTKPQTTHICYMSTVGRMFWESESYFAKESFGGSFILKALARIFLKLPLSYIRVWDKIASQRPDYLIANSLMTRNRIKKYYGRDADLIHPPIEFRDFSKSSGKPDEKYFLVLTRLVSWKRVDIAIEACKRLRTKLKIVGSGPDSKRLRSVAEGSEFVEFLGYVSDKEKVDLLQNCLALIITQQEDFGLTPLEAMACGKPVLAYGKGGSLETVIGGLTGGFFFEQSSESLIGALRSFDPKKYHADHCRSQAKKFDIGVFEKNIKEYTNSKS